VIGDRGLKEGVVEYQHRQDSEATKVNVEALLDLLKAKLNLA
jgi:prolyl-tRNA synthetase